MTHSTNTRHAAVAIVATALTVMFAITVANADDGLFDNDGASTAAGDILESRGDLAEPLYSPVLEPYRRPIEKTLAKRHQPDAEYREFDFIKVHRMIKRMEEAIDSIRDELDVRELVALKDYLVQIDYEARFDSKNNRVDF